MTSHPTDKRSIQERLREESDDIFLDPNNLLSEAADRIDTLEKALGTMVEGNDVEDDPSRPDGHIAGEFTYGDLRRARSALHPSDNETGGVGIK